jgi:NAD(P)-dependent dehydrogenase (short-subunit alcohol dehydrogenase family)
MDDSSQPMALVTGAARGLGFEVARQLAQQGITVLLTARDDAQGLAAAQRLAAEGLAVQHAVLDVADPASIRQLAASLDRLDILINNAAARANWTETATTTDLEATHVLFETNLFGPWRMVQAMLPLLRASKHGRIVNISSGGGSHGDALFPLTRPHREHIQRRRIARRCALSAHREWRHRCQLRCLQGGAQRPDRQTRRRAGG